MNLIYQYWDGPVRESCRAGVENMKAYAKSIGARYVFEDNPQYVRKHLRKDFGSYSPHYGAFKPVFEEELFGDFDKLLFVDTDVFAVDDLKDNIFEEFEADFGICTEPFQPKQRQITLGRITTKQDELWASAVEKKFGFKVPRTDEGLVKVYNTGVVLYSKAGRAHAREKWVPFEKYVKFMRSTRGLNSFYQCDQPYAHAMAFATGMNVQEMDNGWNSYIHMAVDRNNPKRRVVDHRTSDTKFVHIQAAGSDNMSAEQHWTIANKPKEEWVKWYEKG